MRPILVVVVWASPRENGREEQPDESEHILSIADPPSREVVPPHNAIDETVSKAQTRLAAN